MANFAEMKKDDFEQENIQAQSRALQRKILGHASQQKARVDNAPKELVSGKGKEKEKEKEKQSHKRQPQHIYIFSEKEKEKEKEGKEKEKEVLRKLTHQAAHAVKSTEYVEDIDNKDTAMDVNPVPTDPASTDLVPTNPIPTAQSNEDLSIPDKATPILLIL
ncbi:hypothetical protein K435DRAFT_807821 [Dendrothele bispora CBS 962.96]|uniref:Uncharacterized protein n=1 Tax=Dendrothele bispora (strain CBS 962.96) TaxID=1314807 RepID=A0A4S8L4S1_DENBC|nr:hypothetical protein K435DRAFT_807821 [Dendrothele bispora CBS 962.96]